MTNFTPPATLPCFLVNNLTTNSLEQCKFIIDNNCLEEDSTFDYVYLVYCELGYELRYLSMILIVFFVIVLFLALSAIADEFLCPSLLTVSKNLRMSDSLAGVTLLAFGNGCPDIFSSIAAASGDRPELIVGELLGAGIFCTSIVSGLIFIHSDFKLATRPVLRDTTFYLLAVYLMWSYCWAEELTFYGSLTFIVIYLIYLIVALGGQMIYSRLKGNYEFETQALTSNEAEEKVKIENWFRWREESLRRRKAAELAKKQKEGDALSSSLSSSGQSAKIQYNDGITTIHIGSDNIEKSRESPPLELQIYSLVAKTSANQNGCGHSNNAFIADDGSSQQQVSHDSKRKHKENASNQQQQLPVQQVIKLTEAHQAALLNANYNDLEPAHNKWDELLTHINPIDTKNWKETSWSRRLISIIRAPLLFAAIMTVPVVDSDRKHNNWCRLLNSLHCITVPLAITLILRPELALFGVPVPLLAMVPGVLLAVLVLNTTEAFVPPSYHAVFAYFGFLMSVMWIYTLATEIIGLLKTVGIMFSMTDTAIGLGILAWGNSLGDIVANISLAEAGYPRMAIGASIGAPLLNILLGFGLAFTLSLKPGEHSFIKYSPTITLLCSTLAIILLSLMFSTLAPAEKSKKPFGYLLIGVYGVYFALAVCLECGVIKV